MKADKDKVSLLLKTARGQIDAILKMIDDDRYCIDISNQLLAVISLVKKANTDILSSHMKSCVRESVLSGDDDKKIEEIIKVINKMSK